jgi:hypothetical protein
MTKDEALKMAIEALNDSLTRFSTFNEIQHDAIQACIDALDTKQPEQEPMTHVIGIDTEGYAVVVKLLFPPKQWQGLSDDEVHNIWFALEHEVEMYILYGAKLARTIEAKLREKNHASNN